MQKTETPVMRVATATGVLVLTRVVDFEAIAAKSEDGRISVDDLKNAGSFTVRYSPKKGDPSEYPVESATAGDAFISGFLAAEGLRKRGGRTKTPEVENVTAKTDLATIGKPQILRMLNAYNDAQSD